MYKNLKTRVVFSSFVLILIVLLSVNALADFAGGDGTELDPYQIETCEQLQEMNTNLTAHYVLVDNVDCSETSEWSWNGSQYLGFEPVGTWANKFRGSLIGQGNNITGLFINRTTDYVGLFGYIGNGGVIKNVGLIDVFVSGNNQVGGFIGENFYGMILDSYSIGNVSGTGNYVGGFVGLDFFGKISNSYSAGSVYGNDRVGGFIGTNRGHINNSYSIGNVSGNNYVGGFSGYNSPIFGSGGIILNSYSTGGVYGNDHVGGLIGENKGTISNSYWDKETSGQSSSDGGEGKTTTEMSQVDTFVGWDILVLEGEDSSYPILSWQEDQSESTWVIYQVPQTFAGGNGTELNPYQIETCEQLQNMNTNLTAHYILISNVDCSETSEWNPNNIWKSIYLGTADKGTEYFLLHSNIVEGSVEVYINEVKRESGFMVDYEQGIIIFDDTPENLYSVSSWDWVVVNYSTVTYYALGFEAIGNNTDFGPYYFTGSLYGDGYNITGLFINRTYGNVVGLFGCVGIGGVVKNVRLVNIFVSETGFVGGLTGINFGTILNSSISGGIIKGGHLVGGLSASNSGEISNSYSTGNVSGTGNIVGGLTGYNGGEISNSYSTGGVSGSNKVGGLVGDNYGEISNSYSTGGVSGNWNIGGLVGWNEGGIVGSSNGRILNSYSTGNVEGNVAVGGLIGKNFLEGIINNSYSIGNITRLSGDSESFGCFGGTNFRGKMLNSYSTGVVYESPGVIWSDGSKGFVGAQDTGGNWEDLGNFFDMETSLQTSTTGNAEGKITAEMKLASTFDDWDIIILEGEESSYPLLGWQEGQSESAWVIYQVPLFNGSGIELDPFEIETCEQLEAMNTNLTAHYILTQNIDCDVAPYNEGLGFEPVGASWDNAFKGSLDGQEYNITGLFINRTTDYIGLFGAVGSGGVVENVGLIDVFVSGGNTVGSLIGDNLGTISNSYSTGNVNGNDFVGSLVGYNYYGTISNSYSTGNVSGNSFVGGLTGYNDYGTISNSYSTGNVIRLYGTSEFVGGFAGGNYRGQISNSYSTGAVYESPGVIWSDGSKGFVGAQDTSGNWEDSGNFFDIETSLQLSTTGNAEGKITAKMKLASTFDDWDIVILEGEESSYPLLGWQEGQMESTWVIYQVSKFYEKDGTIYCYDAEVGDTGIIDGVTYTAYNNTGLYSVRENADALERACTSHVTSFNPSGNWNTGLFYNSDEGFQPNISHWDTSSVINMSNMFSSSQFNGDISSWNTSSVANMYLMFSNSHFNSDISNWQTSSVTRMDGMFSSSQFNGDISAWNTSSVINMNSMFHASQFNNDISNWNTSLVNEMIKMFSFSNFNSDISIWDTSSVTNMNNMFRNSPFNWDISGWNVSSVTNMNNMFQDATNFNQDLSGWCVEKIVSKPTNFDLNANAWEGGDAARPQWGTCPGDDTTPPSIGYPVLYSGNYHPDGNSGAYFKGTVGVRSSVSDEESGINESSCEVNINDGGWVSATYNLGYCQYSYSESSNINSIQFRVSDNAGNQNTSVVSNFIYDNTAPTTTINDTNNDWRTDDVTFSLNCNDGTGSGCSETYYKVLDGDVACDKDSMNVYSIPVDVTCTSGSCVRTVCYYSVDNLDNEEEVNKQVYQIDFINILSPQNTSYSNKNVILNLSYTNLETVWYVLNDVPVLYTEPITVSFNEGYHEINVYGNDSLGNIFSKNVGFTIDLTPPKLLDIKVNLPRRFNESNKYNFNVSLKDKSDVDTVKLFYKNTTIEDFVSEIIPKVGDSYFLSLTNVPVGNYSYYIWANDTVGNSGNLIRMSYFNIQDVLPNNTHVAINQTYYVNESEKIIVFDSVSEPIKICAEQDAQVTLNLRNIVVDQKTTFNQNVSLSRNISSSSIEVKILENTKMIVDDETWDKNFMHPSIEDNIILENKKVFLALKVGSNFETKFDKPVKLRFSNQTSNRVAWKRQNTELIEITTICNNAESPTNIYEELGSSQCKIQVDQDLIIWTYHFTTFILYDDLDVDDEPRRSSGSSGSSARSQPVVETCVSEWRCTSWSLCKDNVMTRSCRDINSCEITTNTKPEEYKECYVEKLNKSDEDLSDTSIKEKIEREEDSYKKPPTEESPTDEITDEITKTNSLIYFIVLIFMSIFVLVFIVAKTNLFSSEKLRINESSKVNKLSDVKLEKLEEKLERYFLSQIVKGHDINFISDSMKKLGWNEFLVDKVSTRLKNESDERIRELSQNLILSRKELILKEYFLEQLHRGYSKKQVSDSLINVGWNKDLVLKVGKNI